MAHLYSIEEIEFKQLVSEVECLNFTTCSQVSNYIMSNRLGEKYSHISGNLQIKRGNDTWNFKGGISPKYYAKLCEALKLKNPR